MPGLQHNQVISKHRLLMDTKITQVGNFLGDYTWLQGIDYQGTDSVKRLDPCLFRVQFARAECSLVAL